MVSPNGGPIAMIDIRMHGLGFEHKMCLFTHLKGMSET